MKLPVDEIDILGHTYKLCAMPSDVVTSSEEDLWGVTLNDKLIILINTSYPPSHVAATLSHEILHAIWFLMHIQEKDDEERIVSAMSNGMAETMRHNPKLYHWLVRMAAK